MLLHVMMGIGCMVLVLSVMTVVFDIALALVMGLCYCTCDGIVLLHVRW